MKKEKFSLEQKQELLQNSNIIKVNDRSVEYSPEFKIYAVERQKLGVSPKAIFSEKNIPEWLNKFEYARYCIKRWKKIIKRDGKSNFKFNKRGYNNSYTIKNKPLSEMNSEELMARIAYLEVENDFLKKLKALETI